MGGKLLYKGITSSDSDDLRVSTQWFLNKSAKKRRITTPISDPNQN